MGDPRVTDGGEALFRGRVQDRAGGSQRFAREPLARPFQERLCVCLLLEPDDEVASDPGAYHHLAA